MADPAVGAAVTQEMQEITSQEEEFSLKGGEVLPQDICTRLGGVSKAKQ